MANFVLIHGAGDSGWYWHLVEKELQKRGHDSVAPDLPCDDDQAGLDGYADVVVDAVGDREELIVVAQSFGGFIAPLVADRVAVDALVLVAGMVPLPKERPVDWPRNTRLEEAIQEQAQCDGGVTGNKDPAVLFYHDVPPELTQEALRGSRYQSETPGLKPLPLDAWPRVKTKFVACKQDRLFPLPFMRRVVKERLGFLPDEIDAGHCVALSRPKELADMLVSYASG